jgi:predicted outer membrane lipoprotein
MIEFTEYFLTITIDHSAITNLHMHHSHPCMLFNSSSLLLACFFGILFTYIDAAWMHITENMSRDIYQASPLAHWLDLHKT